MRQAGRKPRHPLQAVDWWRVCIDEAHMVANQQRWGGAGTLVGWRSLTVFNPRFLRRLPPA